MKLPIYSRNEYSHSMEGIIPILIPKVTAGGNFYLPLYPHREKILTFTSYL